MLIRTQEYSFMVRLNKQQIYRNRNNSTRVCLISIRTMFYALVLLCLVSILSVYYVAMLNPMDDVSIPKDAIKASQKNNPKQNTKINLSSKPIAKEHDSYVDRKGKATVQAKASIAYMISLTHCSPMKENSTQQLHDGAAVLKHSIHLNSFENYESSKSLYSYKMYAIVHPIAESCSKPLADLGYEIWIRETPINVTDIKTEFLRTKVVTNGCCGEKEYNKLWVYTVNPEEHPIAVHLDIDTLVLKPFDDLFDAMLDGSRLDARERIPVMFDKELPPSNDIQAYFTRDYNMVQPGKKHVGVQGGFIVVRPNTDTFEEYKKIIIEGKFFPGSGWGGLGYGGFFGGMTFQGIVPYFYDHKHPGVAVELNRCNYNAMADNPRVDVKNKPDPRHPGLGLCRDGRPECEDCRKININNITSIHFTLCQKPWTCRTFENNGPLDLCNKFHHEWFKVRKHLDSSKQTNKTSTTIQQGKYYPEHFMGYCKGTGGENYIPMELNIP